MRTGRGPSLRTAGVLGIGVSEGYDGSTGSLMRLGLAVAAAGLPHLAWSTIMIGRKP